MTSYLNEGDSIGGRYRIIRPLSAGGMGAVYLAEQTSLGREVAIKVILEGVKDKETLDRFDLEARAVCLLKHPNIITYHDYGRDDKGNPFIVMEFLPGFPASKLFDVERGATLEVLMHVASQMCSALGEAHRAGIVHRDLKWTNIMICPQGHDEYFAKLIDFGIVKMPADHAMKKGITQTGMLLGTPQYMPPEAIQGKGVDGRADQYSLGVMLWEGIEGKKPFDADSMFEVFRMHVQDPTPEFTKGKALLDNYPGLEDAIVRAMSKDPADRFPTILHFQQALHAAMGLGGGPSSIELARTSLPGGTGLTPSSRRGRGGTGLQPMDTRLRTGAAEARPGIPKWAMGAIGVGVALAAVAAILVATGGKDTEASPITADNVTNPAFENPDGADAGATAAAPDVVEDKTLAAATEDVTSPTPEAPETSVAAVTEDAGPTAGTSAIVADAGGEEPSATPDVTEAAPTDVAEPPDVQVEVPKDIRPPPRDTEPAAPRMRKLTVSLRPWGSIMINGKDMGQAPFTGELATNKTYRIVGSHPSLGKVEKTIRLTPDSSGKAMFVNLSFDK